MNEYKVNIGGLDHTVQLSDEEAKAAGLSTETKDATPPANKARSTSQLKNK